MIHIYDGMAVLRRRFDDHLPGPFGRGPRSVFNEMLAIKPGDVAIWCFEGRGAKQARQKFFPGYKDRPSQMTDGLHALVNLTRDALKHTKALQVAVPQREADDVIGHLCGIYGIGDGDNITVHTVDRDLLQLAGPKVRINGVTPLKIIVDKDDVKKDVVLTPGEIRLYKALCGDPSDRIPGMPGFGPKAFAACNRAWLNSAMQQLIAGHPKPALFEHAGVKPAMAQRMCNPEQAEQLRVFWKIVGFLPLPDDWQSNILTGKPDQAAGSALLQQYMH